MNLIGKKVKWLRDDPINGVSKDSMGEVVDSEYDDSSDILRLAVKTSDEPYKYWYKIGSPYIEILEGVKMKKTIIECAQRYLEEDEIPSDDLKVLCGQYIKEVEVALRSDIAESHSNDMLVRIATRYYNRFRRLGLSTNDVYKWNK